MSGRGPQTTIVTRTRRDRRVLRASIAVSIFAHALLLFVPLGYAPPAPRALGLAPPFVPEPALEIVRPVVRPEGIFRVPESLPALPPLLTLPTAESSDCGFGAAPWQRTEMQQRARRLRDIEAQGLLADWRERAERMRSSRDRRRDGGGADRRRQ